MWTFFFLLAVGIICGLLVWDYRRKARQREAISQERFAKMFEGARVPAGGAQAVPVAAAAPLQPAATPAKAERRFLGPAETLVYFLLRAGLPDCPVFARVPVASVLGSAAALRVASATIDFVVCDKAMEVVAVIELRDSKAAVTRRLDPQAFRETGIRLVTLDPRSLPRRAELRAVVLGEGTPAA